MTCPYATDDDYGENYPDPVERVCDRCGDHYEPQWGHRCPEASPRWGWLTGLILLASAALMVWVATRVIP